MTFKNLKLDPKLLKAVADAGYTEPTEIQEQVIPVILEGSDIRASAQTGTGKTAAFILPAINRCLEGKRKAVKGPKVLVIAPTRELVMQIAEQAQLLGKYANEVKTVCISGGVPYHSQMRQLMRPYDLLIATPGRLLDFIKQKKINLSSVEILVLDEADRMVDMGFFEPVSDIVALTPSTRQTLLFSATLRGNVMKAADKFLNEPVTINIHSEHARHENISQGLHYVDDLNHKNKLLDHILGCDHVDHTIIFTSTKRHAAQLVEELHEKGHRVAALHGDMNQRQRTRTIARMKEGKIEVLVATDVAARGIDVQSVTHVINFDLPHNVEDYVHRIGRTGRAGAKGAALSFAGGRDRELVKRIEKFTGQKIDVLEVAGLEPRRRGDGPSDSRPRKRYGQRPFSREKRWDQPNRKERPTFSSKKPAVRARIAKKRPANPTKRFSGSANS